MVLLQFPFLFIPGMAFIVQSYGNHEQASTTGLFTYKFSGSLSLLTALLSKVVFQKTCRKFLAVGFMFVPIFYAHKSEASDELYIVKGNAVCNRPAQIS
jgi:hypothetical protein